MLLRDYLALEVGSCSSSGFEAFPRRQCCSVVKCLFHSDLRNSKRRHPNLLTSGRSRGRAGALRRATEAVVNAIKSVPSPSRRSIGSAPSPRTSKVTTVFLLPRFLTRKMLRLRAARRKPGESRDVVVRLAAYFQMDPLQPSNTQYQLLEFVPSPPGTPSRRFPESDAASSEYEFAVSESSNEAADTVSVTNESSGVTERAAPAKAADAATPKRRPRESKEQNSPVSVLDCLFEEEDEESCVSGREKNVRCGGSSTVEPVVLHERYAKSSSYILATWCLLHEKEDEGKGEEMDLAKGTEEDKLLADLLGSLSHDKGNVLAKDWLDGKPDDVALGWHSERGRRAYLRDMERHEDWMRLHAEEEELSEEIGEEAFNTLLEEALQVLL